MLLVQQVQEEQEGLGSLHCALHWPQHQVEMAVWLLLLLLLHCCWVRLAGPWSWWLLLLHGSPRTPPHPGWKSAGTAQHHSQHTAHDHALGNQSHLPHSECTPQARQRVKANPLVTTLEAAGHDQRTPATQNKPYYQIGCPGTLMSACRAPAINC